MTDIVERLRMNKWSILSQEAADEIGRLQGQLASHFNTIKDLSAEIKRLRAAEAELKYVINWWRRACEALTLEQK